MEMREYIGIFRRQAGVFWSITLFLVATAFVWQSHQPVVYQASLLLDIGRSGIAVTPDYTYDGFYRVQADERFADTVVRWLGDPRVVQDIYAEAGLKAENLGLKSLAGAFSAGRLSSEVIEVSYRGMNQRTLADLAPAVSRTLERYTRSLNVDRAEPGWFTIVGNEPVIRDARIALWPALGAGLVAGLVAAFWIVLLRHYFSRERHADRD